MSARAASSPFPAFSHRGFRLFWLGQCLSLMGTWMQNIGQSWLVLELTGSAVALGLVNALQFLPMMLLSLFAGPLVDALPKRRVLLVTQTALLVLAAALAVITLTGIASYWMVLVLALLLGLVNTLDVPTRQAFVIELVGREHLMNAISLNSAAFNLARLAGPAVAGLLIAAIGTGPCFVLNALSFVGPLGALLAMGGTAGAAGAGAVPGGLRAAVRPQAVLASTREGLAYVARRPDILWPLVLLGVIGTFVINHSVVVPLFVRGELGGDAASFGFLMASLGCGSFLAAMTLAARSRRGPRLRAMALGSMAMSLCLGLAGFQRSFALSCLLFGLAGFATITFTATCNAWIQTRAEDRMRGRVMSLHALVFGGLTPVGSLYAGQLCAAFGAGVCLVVSGGIGFAAAAGMSGLAWRKRRAAARAGSAEPAEGDG